MLIKGSAILPLKAIILATALVHAGSDSVQSGEFTATNKSSSDVTISYFCKELHNYGDDVPVQQWRVYGWYVVKPGERKTIYNGNNRTIFVRVTKGSSRGEVVRPSNPESRNKSTAWVHDMRFVASRGVNSTPPYPWNLAYGNPIGKPESDGLANYQYHANTRNPKEAGFWFAEDYYEMDSATNYAIN